MDIDYEGFVPRGPEGVLNMLTREACREPRCMAVGNGPQGRGAVETLICSSGLWTIVSTVKQ